MNKKFSEILKNLPTKPGVYRFYSFDDSLLYIGKAKNLKNRINSYFQNSRFHNQRTSLMISQIERIEYTIVDSEKESLILEANLVHSLQPKYNILLKDDKSYIYIRITDDEIPGIFLTRRKYDPKSLYFGPYTQKYSIEETLRILRTIFPYCQERKIQNKPCAYVGIKQCEGICNNQESPEEYKQKIEQIKNVLKGKTKPVESFLHNKMHEAVKLGNFELAALWRDRFKILRATLETQKITLPHPQDIDLITLVTEKNHDGLTIGSIFLQTIREGKVTNNNNFLLSGSESDEENQLEFSFLQRFLKNYSSLQANSAPILLQTFRLAQ